MVAGGEGVIAFSKQSLVPVSLPFVGQNTDTRKITPPVTGKLRLAPTMIFQ